jgi:hypothetical protein
VKERKTWYIIARERWDMEKLIYVEDLKPGDVFSFAGGPTHETPGIRIEARECADCRCTTKQVVRIDIPGGHQEVAPRTVVTLHHRPHPKGETSAGMLHRIHHVIQGVLEEERSYARDCETCLPKELPRIRELIEAYELGLPPKEGA